MRIAAVLLTGLLAGCLPIERIQPIAGNDPRQQALAKVRPGRPIRLMSSELGFVEATYHGQRGGKLILSRDTDVLTVDVATIQQLQVHQEFSVAGAAAGAGFVFLLPLILDGVRPYGRRGGAQAGAMGNTLMLLGAGVGLALGGVTSGWAQVWPDRIRPTFWVHAAPAAIGTLRAEVQLSEEAAGRGHEVTATISITNASADTVDLLERGCGPLLMILNSAGREWAAPPCEPGLRVTRLAPGTLTRELRFGADFPSGGYHVEARVIRLARVRAAALDTTASLRFAARTGLIVQ